MSDTGSVALTALTYKVVMSNGLSLATFTLAACTTPWVGGLCDGGAGTAIGGSYRVGTTTTISSSVVPPLGGSIYLQGTASSLSVTAITMTLTVSVTAKTQTRRQGRHQPVAKPVGSRTGQGRVLDSAARTTSISSLGGTGFARHAKTRSP